jgi:hypothetical protein
MKTNENDIELVERYIDGELKGNDLEIFENRLKEEPELARKYEARRKMAALWRKADEYEKTRNEIAATIHIGRTSFFQRNKTYILSIAASVAVLLGIYLMFFQHRNNLNNSQQLVVTDTVNRETPAIEFQTDVPERLATMDVLNDSVELIFPVNNINFTIKEPVVLKWRSFSDKTDTLYIFNVSKNLLIKKLVTSYSVDTNTYNAGALSPGKYYWYFSGMTKKGAFSVIKNNN